MKNKKLNKQIKALLKKGYTPKEVYDDMSHLNIQKNILIHSIAKESKIKVKGYRMNVKM